MKMNDVGRLWILLLLAGCAKDKIKDNTQIPNPADTTRPVITVFIQSDKSVYQPGDIARFSLDKIPSATARIRYKMSGGIVEDELLSGVNWTWKTPTTDFKGYMAELYDVINGSGYIYGTIGVDVSSDPARFPRNGFLSAYGPLNDMQVNLVMSALNRYHINYVQFQDWEYEHHAPLSGTVGNPDAIWKDIANRDNYLTTVKSYIHTAHGFNMKSLTYNLAYGALNNAAGEGVLDQWCLFDDASHATKEVNPLPSPMFKSNIYIMDPANSGWQQYLAAKTNDAYAVFDFDGFQIDQLGDRNKTLYSYSGEPVDLPSGFAPFITAMKNSAPQKRLVMNAVSQYGQSQIASTDVDFMYSEIWSPRESFKDLATVIIDNDDLTGGEKRSVLAAYMNSHKADNTGYFNTPGVVLADAVIFAFGGSHLELGEHMLCKEYFPNANLLMPDDLKTAMIHYYDFLTGYENLLRDGGTINFPVISPADNKLKLNAWPPQTGQVSVIGRDFGNKQVIHLINFTNANTLQWRDTDGTQASPSTISKPAFRFTANKPVKRIWMASPDINGGASADILFTQSGDQISFTIPSLLYWDMIIVEFQ